MESSSLAGTVSEAASSLNAAYGFLIKQMDQYHNVFYVYKDRNAGGNHFVPSGWMGDYGDIGFKEGWTNNPSEGGSCLRISYSAASSQGNKWAGIYWQSIDQNWGDKGPGYDLSGVTRLRFQARGEYGGEKAIFKVGGINWQPYHNAAFPYQDSCETLAIGPVSLGTNWATYEIDLTTPENFKIYAERFSSLNHFVPSAWYNGAANMTLTEECTEAPHSGQTCVKITWNGGSGFDSYRWNGVGWEWPEGRIQYPNEFKQGYDLSGATHLRFWARTDRSDAQLKFIFGHPNDPCGEVGMPGGDGQGYVPVGANWTQFTLPVPPEKSMTNVTLGFAVFFNDTHDPGGQGFSIYLDDIEFDKPIRKDLTNLMGGFCWVTDKTMNPTGCTIYLDNIFYDKSSLSAPRFLQSYVIGHGTNEYILNNWATTYDNALALLAFSLSGDTNHLARARLIADAFVEAASKDRDFTDGRLRNVYRSGDLIDPFTGKALLSGWWDADMQKWLEDVDAVGSKVGDLVWAALALSRIHRITGETNYLRAVETLGEWIVTNTWSTGNPGGFTGGYWGWIQGTLNIHWGWYTWKSTEHNLDAWRMFDVLAHETGDDKWALAATHARTFVESMWNEQQGFFQVGTTEDGTTVNTNLMALDPNSWGVSAFCESATNYAQAINWAEANCLTTCGSFLGFDFNNDRDGVWFEGTAQMALAYLCAHSVDRSEQYLRELRRAQREALNTDGGCIVAACKDPLSTGLGWSYYARPHVAATCWYIFAELGYNPFLDITIPRIREVEPFMSGLAFGWTSTRGQTCRVERVQDLKGAWEPACLLTTKQWQTQWSDSVPSSMQAFYRLVFAE